MCWDAWGDDGGNIGLVSTETPGKAKRDLPNTYIYLLYKVKARETITSAGAQ